MTSIIANDEGREILKRWAQGHLGRAPIEVPHANPDDVVVSQPMFENLTETPMPPNPVDLFRDIKNHQNAVGRIWTFCSDKSGFIPANGLEDQADKYPDYITRISTFPGFYLSFNRESSRMTTSVDINKMINDVKSLYDGVFKMDPTGIIDSLLNMAASIANSKKEKIEDSLFTQMAIADPEKDGQLIVSIFYSNLKMEVETSGKKTYRSQSYSVQRTVFTVNHTWMQAYAQDLSNLLGLGDWGQAKRQLSSPTSGHVMSCFKKHLDASAEENAVADAVREQ